MSQHNDSKSYIAYNKLVGKVHSDDLFFAICLFMLVYWFKTDTLFVVCSTGAV